MARYRKTGADHILDAMAKLPWWVGVVLALLIYLLLHKLGAPAPAAPLQPGTMGPAVFAMMLTGLAHTGQFVVPPLCLVGAAVSFWRHRQRDKAAIQAESATHRDATSRPIRVNSVKQTERPATPQGQTGSTTIPATSAHATTPVCPKCAAPMVRRTAMKGANAGQAFWGCSTYPGCKGIVRIGQ